MLQPKKNYQEKDARIIIKGNFFLNYAIFKKTITEKKLLSEVKKKYNENKRKIFKDYIKTNASFGLISNSMKDIGSMLKRADNIEIEIAALK